MLGLWDSVTELRRIEFIVLLVTMITPVLCGTVILSIRHRIKTLQMQSIQSERLTYEQTVHKLENKTQQLETNLQTNRHDLSSLRQMAAPRQLTAEQQQILLEKLRRVKAAPVIVAAYSFEEESAAYAAQIASVLRQAGWEVTINHASMNDFKGVSLGTVNLMRKPLIGLHELAEAFTAAQLELRQRNIAPDSIAGSLEDGSLLVIVGRK